MPRKKKLKAKFVGNIVYLDKSDESNLIYDKNRIGVKSEDGELHLSYLEALFLKEKGTISLYDGKDKEISKDKFIKKVKKTEPNFWIRYCVFKDIRNRGYIVKTALKFGADFRVYERGVKPGEDHAKWIVYPVKEGEGFTWHDFAAKNRVAHSTKKRLMLGIVDEEGDVTYYEVRWIRP